MKKKETTLEEAMAMYPGVDWEQKMQLITNAFDLAKILDETPEETEKRILEKLAEARKTNIDREEMTKEERCYFWAQGYILLNFTSTRLVEGENKPLFMQSRRWEREQETEKGQEALDRMRLHNVDRIVIDLLHSKLEKKQNKERPLLSIKEEDNSYSFTTKRKVLLDGGKQCT